jgi:O-antigen/teichoic acid export membrane protein
MSVLKKLAGETAIYGISSVIGRFLNLLLTPFYTEIFSKGTYGIIGNLYSYIAFANVFLTFGMETAFFRFSEDHDDPKKAYNQAFVWVSSLVLLVLLIGLLSYRTLAGWMGYEGQENLILMTFIIISIDGLAALPMAKLRKESRAKRFAIINLTNIGLSLFLNILFIAVLDLGLEYVFGANIIASSVRLGLALTTGLPSSFKPDIPLLKQMAHYGFFIMIAGLAGMMNETLDRILIPFLWEDGTLWGSPPDYPMTPHTGNEINGIYNACYKLSLFILLVTQAFRYAAEPFFFREAKDKKSPETFARVFHYFMIAVLAGFMLISSYAHEIVSFNIFGLTGDKTFIDEAYWIGLKVVPILLLAYVFSAAYINLSIWFKITKQTRFAILFAGTGALITIVINVLTIPRHGYMGSAWATLAAYGTMCVLCYYLGQKYYPIPYRVQRLFIYALVFLTGYAINQSIGPTAGYWPAFFFKLMIAAAAIGAVYVGEKYYPVFGSNSKSENHEHS